jgi:hypothetical protein
MFNFCHKNFIKYGWGNQTYGHRTSSDAKFWIKYGRCNTEPSDFRNECIRAARLIYESTNKKILIHLSGGIDSEIICRAFLEAKLPFEVCIWKFKDDLNYHDIIYAIDFCKKYDIKINEIEIDIIKFIGEDMFNIYKDNFCPNWWANIVKYVVEKMDGYQIFGDGHANFNHDPLGIKAHRVPAYIPPVLIPTKYYKSPPVLEAKTYKIIAEGRHYNILPYMDQINKEGCTEFFYYTPELIYSYIKDDFIQDWLKYCKMDNIENDRLYPTVCHVTRNHIFLNGNDYIRTLSVNSTFNLKQHIQYKHWPEMKNRPKYSGIDKIRPIIIDQGHLFGRKYTYNTPGNEIVAIPAEDFIRSLECE